MIPSWMISSKPGWSLCSHTPSKPPPCPPLLFEWCGVPPPLVRACPPDKSVSSSSPPMAGMARGSCISCSNTTSKFLASSLCASGWGKNGWLGSRANCLTTLAGAGTKAAPRSCATRWSKSSGTTCMITGIAFMFCTTFTSNCKVCSNISPRKTRSWTPNSMTTTVCEDVATVSLSWACKSSSCSVAQHVAVCSSRLQLRTSTP
mmetsp:Transcript_131827/g.328714  ORF Transcript_131827/g.328714 Transcript_131827/m.328714 type:complete len:204 (+) Transcript_131827:609-1220(+)